jgi:hypothetical protein
VTSITMCADAGPMVTVKSNEQETVSVSQIGTRTPLAIVWPAEKFNVLANGRDDGQGWTVRWPSPLGPTATTLMNTPLAGPKGTPQFVCPP